MPGFSRRILERASALPPALAVLVASLALAPAPPARGAPGLSVSHGLTLLDELKYGPEFRHLDHVDPDAPKGGSVRRYVIGSFDTFNPFTIKGQPAAGLGFVFERLMDSPPDEISAEYGLIASHVEVPDDLSYVVYRLRPEARFHDGAPITADDVVFSFDVLKSEGAPIYRFYYADVERAEKLGPRRVKFHFTGPPNRELPQIVGQIPILPAHVWRGRDFGKTTLEPPLGSGPYRLSRFEPGRFVEYERVADYWGADVPINRGRYNFDRMRFDYYRDQTVALEAFKSRQYDIRLESSSKEWATAYRFPAVASGLVRKAEIPHARPTGMQAFAFNLRREKFRDRAVRRAMAFAFDFEWSNKNLFHGQYTRTKSFFSNSALAARALPSAAERELLERFRGQVPEEVFSTVYEPPSTDGSGNVRGNLRKAARLLRRAGWRIEDGALIDPAAGRPMEVEFLLASPAFERVVSPYIRNLRRLGVRGTIRTVDQAQYVNRVRDFDFDVIVQSFGQSESPGNEQRDYWSSAAADRPGSRNVVGIRNPAVDALIEAIVAAPDRAGLVVATRALDRVLLWSHYVVPQWHIRFDRIAWWDRFGRTGRAPKYGPDIASWWVDPAKDAALDRRREDAAR